MRQAQQGLQKRRKSILIIEDHRALRDLLVMTFTFSGYEVMTVEPSSCFTWMTDLRHAVPDGVVLDVDIFWYAMVQEDVKDFLLAFCTVWQQVSFSTRCPPLLMLTTQPMKQQMLEQEGYLVVTKPFKPTHLVQQMKKIMDMQQS